MVDLPHSCSVQLKSLRICGRDRFQNWIFFLVLGGIKSHISGNEKIPKISICNHRSILLVSYS